MPLSEHNASSAATPIAQNSYRHFVIGAVIYLFICQCGVLIHAIPIALAGRADFRNLYTAGYMVRTGAGHQLYDFHLQEKVQNLVTPPLGFMPYVYPAYTALLFAPLSLLSFRTAYGVFFAVNLLLLWISARLARDSLPHLSALWPPLPIALFLGFFPVAIALMQGQTSILLLTFFCASFYSLQKGNPLRAGIFLGLAIFKIPIVLPFVLLMASWRRWRFVMGFLTGAAAAMLAFLCVTGVSAFVQYWRWLFLVGASVPGSAAAIPMPPEMMPNLYGLTQVLSRGAAWGAHLHAAAALLILLWMAFLPESMPMAVVGSILISRYMGIHDLVLLLLPISLALNHAVAHPLEPGARASALLGLILLAPPLYLSLMGTRLICWLAVVLLAFLFCLGLTQWNPSNSVVSSLYRRCLG